MKTMPTYEKFQTKNAKYSRDRYDIYEPAFETPLQKSKSGANTIKDNIDEWVKFCSFIRWYPDIFWDMYKPETGGIKFDLDQRVMMRLLARFSENYFCIPRGSSKCVTGNTYLFTENGIKTIGEFFNYSKLNQELVLNHDIRLLNKDGRLETSNYGIINGLQDTKRIITEDGYEIEGTYNHPLLCIDTYGNLVFKQLQDISIGDYIAISRNNDIWGSNTKIDFDMDAFLDTFSKSYIAEIPKSIMASTKDVVCNIFKKMYDMNGNIVNNKIKLCVASEKISKQIQLLLLNFGIISCRKCCTSKEGSQHYEIIISHYNIDLFYKNIGFSYTKKQKKLKKCLFYNKDIKSIGCLIHFQDDYYYSKVDNIINSKNYVYDLQTGNTHSFVGNGFINHNTFLHILVKYHAACCYPNLKQTITASTKESAVKIWKDKHDEILAYYPTFAENFKSVNFNKDLGRVEFVNGAVIDNLANSQSSKGLRRHRGGLEESALIDKEVYDDAIEPIFNIGRFTMGGIIDPLELNGSINRFSTSGYRNSDEYDKILQMARDMVDLKGKFVYGSDWIPTVYFGRQKKSTIDKARRSGNIVAFRQNYLCDWVGASNGALINISKMIKARIISKPELSCPRDKNKNYELNEYVIGVDVARSASDANNKTAIVVLKIIRNESGYIRQVQVVNILVPPNGLNYEQQSVIVKRVYYQYGGSLDKEKSRVKAVVIDGNTIGQGLVEKLLEDVTDPETGEELGCWATINTDDKSAVMTAPSILYVLKAQGINGDIIMKFVDYVESGRLKLLKPFADIKNKLPKHIDKVEVEKICLQTQFLLDEIANLKLKKTSRDISVERVVHKIDKDRYSALAYALYYIAMFLEKVNQDIDDEDDPLVYY